MTRDRRDALASAALAIAVFAPTALLCGFYLDDYAFLRDLEGASPHALWRAFVEYVPGRNLHVPALWAAITAARGSAFGLHAISVLFDAALAALAFKLAVRTTGRRSVGLAAAAMFVLMPHHGETHFWMTLIAQCQIPLLLTLAAFLCAFESRLWAALGLYAVALFTYDQVFFLWPLLLAAAWSADRSVRVPRYAGAAAAALALDVAHLTLRYVSPYASGGRPVIRTGELIRRAWDALRSLLTGTFPWPSTPKAPVWAIAAAALLALGAAWWWVREVRRAAEGEDERRSGLLRAAAFGFAWAALAYAPNLFWFVSPRHGLIPSIGWAIAICSLAALAVARWKALAKAAPVLAGLWFAMAAVADVCEGTQWADSARMRERFAAAVRTLTPPVDNIFLIGAPRYMRRAPGFNLYHDVVLAAGRAIGNRSLTIGDYTLSPTSRGFVFFNDLTSWGPEEFRWIPDTDANVLRYLPDGTFARGAPEWPERSVRLIESRAPSGKRSGELSLVRASATAVEGGTRLTFEWKGLAAKRPLALVPRLVSAEGAVLLDAVFPSTVLKAKEPTLWPLVDELAGSRQVFELSKPLPSGAVRIVVDAYEVGRDFAPRRLGRFEAPLGS